MKKLLLAFGFVLFILVLSACGSTSYDEFLNVVDESSDLESVEDTHFLYYFSSSCAYCAKFKPVLEEYTNLDSNIPIYQMDLDKETSYNVGIEYAEKYKLNIQGTPTLVLIHNGEVIEQLDGVQELEDIPLLSDFE